MILHDIEDYHKHKLLIPKCSESVALDEAIRKYQKMQRMKKKPTQKNEAELQIVVQAIEYLMQRLKDVLIIRGLWG